MKIIVAIAGAFFCLDKSEAQFLVKHGEEMGIRANKSAQMNGMVLVF